MKAFSESTVSAERLIEQLNLEPLRDEGGYFRRIFTHPMRIEASALPTGFDWSRELMTGIYYMVTAESFSALHRLSATETFHYHGGDALEMLQLQHDGSCGWQRIGMDLANGEEPVAIVPGGAWQGTRLAPGGTCGWALLSVMVSPGFDWEDFQLGDRALLIEQFPGWEDAIKAMTR